MRHYYFRIVFGIIWLLAAGVSLYSANWGGGILYTALGIFFLLSARKIRKKGDGK